MAIVKPVEKNKINWSHLVNIKIAKDDSIIQYREEKFGEEVQLK